MTGRSLPTLRIQRLREEAFAIVLLDFFLPDSQGIEALRSLRDHARDAPIVVMTGLNDEALGRQMVKAGTQAYIVKGQTEGTALLRTLRDAIARHRAR
jgi:DNA-binding NarL/FixJ family response regulator